MSVCICGPFATMAAFKPDVSIDFKKTSSWPTLHQAIVGGRFEEAMEIIAAHPEQVVQIAHYEKIPDALYPIIIAAADRDFNWGSRDLDDIVGTSVLELAIFCDAPIELIENLISLLCDVNFKRLNVLGEVGEVEMLELFPDFQNASLIEVITPLSTAIAKKNDEVIQMLLNAGADSKDVFFSGTYIAKEDQSQIILGVWMDYLGYLSSLASLSF